MVLLHRLPSIQTQVKPEGHRRAEAGLWVGAPTPGLTLPPAAADLPEAGALAQTIEPLLFDQLHDLRLDLLPQLSAEKKTVEDQHKRHVFKRLRRCCRCFLDSPSSTHPSAHTCTSASSAIRVVDLETSTGLVSSSGVLTEPRFAAS